MEKLAGKALNVSCANPLGTVLGIVAVVSSVETAVVHSLSLVYVSTVIFLEPRQRS